MRLKLRASLRTALTEALQQSSRLPRLLEMSVGAVNQRVGAGYWLRLLSSDDIRPRANASKAVALSYRECTTKQSAPDLYRNLSICRLLILLSSVVLGTPSRPAAPFGPATRPILYARAVSISSRSRLIRDEESPIDSDDATASPELSH